MTYVYDTGVLVAADRNDAVFWRKHAVRVGAGIVPLVTAPVVAQASRSTTQVRLRRLLFNCTVVPFTADDAHVVGALVARSGSADVVDAHVAVVAQRVDATILTSDLGDIRALVSHLDRRVPVQPV